MPLFLFVPDRIRVEVQLSIAPEVLALLQKIVDRDDASARIIAATGKLGAANQRLRDVVNANPDPDPQD